MPDSMPSRRPYLIRALYDWVLDSNCTPHLLVAAAAPGVDVPRQFVTDDDRITLNVSPSAVRDLQLGNDWITFSARFSGRNCNISIPPGAVLALYARENGEGMLFGEVEVPETASAAAADSEAVADAPAADGASEEGGDKPRPSHLRVVK